VKNVYLLVAKRKEDLHCLPAENKDIVFQIKCFCRNAAKSTGKLVAWRVVALPEFRGIWAVCRNQVMGLILYIPSTGNCFVPILVKPRTE
jgi:hypothetical protein